MKRLVLFIGLWLMLASTFSVVAQTYTPITVSGFNEDVIAEAMPATTTTSISMDFQNHVQYSQAFATAAGIAGGIANSGTIVSGTRTYQLAAFNGNNNYHVTTTAPQTMTLATPARYSKLSIIGFSTEGSSTISVTVNFTNGTNTVFPNINVQDWFNGTGSVLCCYGRIQRIASGYVADGLPNNPNFYPIDINLSCTDQRKIVQSVTLSITAVTGTMTSSFFYALSGVAYNFSLTSVVNNTNCGSSTGNIALTPAGTGSPFTYAWNTTPAQTTASISNLGAGSYTCTISDVNLCVDTIFTASINAAGSPLPVTVNPTAFTICKGDSVQLTASGASSYSWTPSTGLSATTGAVVRAKPLVTTTYTVTETSSGCNGFTTVVVTVVNRPQLTFNKDTFKICIGDMVNVVVHGANTYTWTPTTNWSPYTMDSVLVYPTVNTNYVVTGVISTGCWTKDTITVLVSPKPVLTLTKHFDTICGSGSRTFTVGGATSYVWSPITGLNNSTAATVTATPTITTNYIVTGSTNGCAVKDSVKVSVFANPTVTVAPTTTQVCANQAVTLTAAGANTYTWSPVTTLSAGTGAVVIAKTPATTTYTVTGKDIHGCKSTASATITITPTPSANYTLAKNPLCLGESVVFNFIGSAPAGSTYAWSPAMYLSSTSTASPTCTPNFAANYTVIISSPIGCADTAQVQVNVSMPPYLSFTPIDTNVCINSPVAINSNNVYSYVWGSSPNYTLNCYNCTNPIVVPSVTGLIAIPVVASNAYNCTTTDTFYFSVNDACLNLVLPDAFTPGNGDGIDDFLKPLGDAKLKEFKVFNRWGNMVFSTDDPNTLGWDGSYNGKQQEIGVYVWYMIFETPFKTVTKKGNVTLLR